MVENSPPPPPASPGSPDFSCGFFNLKCLCLIHSDLCLVACSSDPLGYVCVWVSGCLDACVAGRLGVCVCAFPSCCILSPSSSPNPSPNPSPSLRFSPNLSSSGRLSFQFCGNPAAATRLSPESRSSSSFSARCSPTFPKSQLQPLAQPQSSLTPAPAPAPASIPAQPQAGGQSCTLGGSPAAEGVPKTHPHRDCSQWPDAIVHNGQTQLYKFMKMTLLGGGEFWGRFYLAKLQIW